MSPCYRAMVLVMFAFLPSPRSLSAQNQAPAGGVQAEGSHFQFVRSVSGSKGTPTGGRFSMEDPRTVFYVPDDHQVIVYMEWDGPPGTHHIEGFWKNPDGKVVTLSDFVYEAKDKRFGAFWTLALSDTTAVGMWTLEAHIDGELAGSHPFQVFSGARPADTIPTHRELKAAELYDLAVKSSVAIEKLDRSGQPIEQGSGFILKPNWIVTAFEVINGASKVRITLPDGRKVETNQVTTSDQRKDWAVLVVELGTTVPLERAASNSWNVGDEESYLTASPAGNRVMNDVSINGKGEFPGAGMRINMSSAAPNGAIGSALLNQYGEVVGIVAGSLVPGASGLELLQLRTRIPSGGGTIIQGGIAVPIEALPSTATGKPASFDELMAKGQFIPPVTAAQNIAYGQLARAIDKRGSAPFPIAGGDTYSKRDGTMYVFIMWEGHEKIKGLLTVRLYNLDNEHLNKADLAKPVKLSLSKGERTSLTWPLNIGVLTPGFYRVDIWLDDAPAWRKFFEVTQ
jgi:S1-C subfamily serine protease